jgi:UrcA family protein
MKNLLITATGVLASTIVVVSTFAQTPPPEVTVEAARVMKTTVGHTASGIPIQDVALSYGVSAQGLDLSTDSGKQAFEKRVSDAAMAACKELGRQYPGSTPTDAECAKAATDKAMAQIQKVEAAAAKK